MENLFRQKVFLKGSGEAWYCLKMEAFAPMRLPLGARLSATQRVADRPEIFLCLPGNDPD
jgi:hypothetical protein